MKHRRKSIAALTLAALTLTGCSRRATGDEEPIIMLDGDYTYMANEMLLPMIVGVWESADGACRIVIEEELVLTLSLDGAQALKCGFDYVYLQPGAPRVTELCPELKELRGENGEVFAQIHALNFVPGDSDSLLLELIDDSGAVKIELSQAQAE